MSLPQHPGFETRIASAEHLPCLANGMRACDRREVAALGYGPMAALQTSLVSSPMAWTAFVDDMPVAIWGVASPPTGTDAGEPWMLTTDAVLAHRWVFLRANKPFVRVMLDCYPRLAGMVDQRNIVSIRWLRWLGFAIGEPVPWGRNGEPFRPFEMEAT